MSNSTLKSLLPHIAVVFLLAVACAFYVAPAAFEGKVLTQSDNIQAGGMQAEAQKYTASEGREILWTNGPFSGMPTYQITSPGSNSWNVLGIGAYKFLTLFGGVTSTPGLLFACALGFYILLITLRVDWRLSALGAMLYALSNTHMQLLEAGHVNKLLVASFLAPTLAGIILIFRKQYLLGSFVTTLFVSLQLYGNHLQITYYFFILLGLYFIFQLVDTIRQGSWKNFIISTCLVAGCVGLGVLTNLTQFWTTYEYSQETIRGKSELKTPVGKQTGEQNGLSKEYAFGWSLGKRESFNLIVPDILGATSNESFVQDPESKSLAALRALGNQEQAEKLVPLTTKYWGEQPFTSGAYYYGAILVFLFVLSLFTIRGNIKWWALLSLIVVIVIGQGKNSPGINYFLFDHFPMFNKFRAVTMIFTIGHVILLIGACLGLQAFFDPANSPDRRKKQVLMAGGISLALMLIAYFAGNSSLEGPRDGELAAFPQVLQAVQADRAALIQADVMRGCLFILAAFGILFVSLRTRISPILAAAAVCVLALFDIVGVNKRYLSNDQFVTRNDIKSSVDARPVDQQILADPALSYRVIDFSRGGNPFMDARPSYLHKSLGGYHAAKLMKYQEILDKYFLSGDNSKIKPILDMLNTKYVIQQGPDGNPIAQTNPDAAGNAWFVKAIQPVANADDELEALGSLAVKDTVVMQQAIADQVKDLNIQYDSSNQIRLTKYIPDHLTYEYDAKSDQFAVFSEIYYPPAKGWNLYIDGKQTDGLLKVDYALRGARLPAGKHVVEMKFEPVSYFTGMTVTHVASLLFLLLGLLCAWYLWKNQAVLGHFLGSLSSLSAPEKPETARPARSSAQTQAPQQGNQAAGKRKKGK